MTYRSQNRVASLINGQPTAAQLYFSQLVGATAAAAGIREQDQTVDDLVNRVSAAEFQADGIDAGGIFVRSGNLLKKSATVKDTLDVIATQLQKAIDDAGRFLVDIGAQPISSNEKPPPTNLRTALARNQWAAYQAALGGGLRDVAARALVADMTGESLNNPTDNHFDVSHMSQGIVQWDTPRSEAIRNQFGSYPKQLRSMREPENSNTTADRISTKLAPRARPNGACMTAISSLTYSNDSVARFRTDP
jgi:hypothetical protein